MPTIVGILRFMSRINFSLSCAEHEKSFINSGPNYVKAKVQISCVVTVQLILSIIIEGSEIQTFNHLLWLKRRFEMNLVRNGENKSTLNETQTR